jgi:hypothetical protein
MKIMNITKKKVVSGNVIYRKSIRELIFGLIPYKYKEGNWLNFLKPKTFNENDAMLFKVSRTDSIHTIFMSFPISVFLLDEKLKVIEKVRLNPFEVFIPTKRFRYFVEMVVNKFDEIDLNDELKIVK